MIFLGLLDYDFPRIRHRWEEQSNNYGENKDTTYRVDKAARIY